MIGCFDTKEEIQTPGKMCLHHRKQAQCSHGHLISARRHMHVHVQLHNSTGHSVKNRASLRYNIQVHYVFWQHRHALEGPWATAHDFPCQPGQESFCTGCTLTCASHLTGLLQVLAATSSMSPTSRCFVLLFFRCSALFIHSLASPIYKATTACHGIYITSSCSARGAVQNQRGHRCGLWASERAAPSARQLAQSC